MEVIFSKQVLVSIEEYTNALAKYPISNERIEMKVYQMRSTLLSIGENPFANPVCRYKDLGQSFSTSGNPKNPYLRQFVYKDEANSPWTFAYLINEKLQKVIITKMMYSAFIVKESTEVQKVLSLIERLNRLYS